jgi:hypothetical protein
MAQAPIGKPRVYKTQLPHVTQRAALSDGSNTFAAQQFVNVSSGNLAKVADAGTTVYGFTLDASHASTDEPYTAPFGENHNPVDVLNTMFIVNVMTSAKTVGVGSVSAGSVVVGGEYGIATFSSSGYTDVQGLNYSDTTNKFFRVEEILPDDAAADTNGRVVVSVIATRQ